MVEESRDKQAERICNKNTHVWAQIIGDDDNAHFLKIGRRHAAPGWQRTKKVFKIHLVSLDRIIYKRILNNILIYWHQVNLWELCLFTERIKDFKENYLLYHRKVMTLPLVWVCTIVRVRLKWSSSFILSACKKCNSNTFVTA